MKSHGYTLLESIIATSILSIVSLLGFIVLKSSNDAAQLTSAKVDVQNNLRDTMSVLTRELREGVTKATTELTGAPEGLSAVALDGEGTEIVFQIPDPQPGQTQIAYSTPIRFQLQFEDGNGNGKLDPDEDENGDGVLTRRVVRIQDGVTTPIASANNIDSVEFILLQNQDSGNDNLTTVSIRLTGSKRHGTGDGHAVVSELSSTVRLVN